MVVQPKTSASLPIAGTLAGGPLVGAAMLVAQQLLGDEVDSMTQIQYSVKGPWADPEVNALPGEGGALNKAWAGLKSITGLDRRQQKEELKNE